MDPYAEISFKLTFSSQIGDKSLRDRDTFGKAARLEYTPPKHPRARRGVGQGRQMRSGPVVPGGVVGVVGLVFGWGRHWRF
jgi:hypothetical protein